MAVYREEPKCPFCGKSIAKPVYKKYLPHESPIYGDNFERWDFFDHLCKPRNLNDNVNQGRIKSILNKLFNN